MPEKKTPQYGSPNREQHGTPKIVLNPPASSVAKALANNAALVNATKKAKA